MKRVAVGTAGALLLSALSMMMGIWVYKPRESVLGAAGERPVRAHGQTETVQGHAERLVETHARLLGLNPVAPPKPVAVKSLDPLSSVQFSGVVEKSGTRLAIFVVGGDGASQVVTRGLDEEVVPAWKVINIEGSTATLAKGTETRIFRLFE